MPGPVELKSEGLPDYIRLIDRGWDIVTLMLTADRIGDLEGAENGVISHSFEIHYGLFIQSYTATILYNCDE